MANLASDIRIRQVKVGFASHPFRTPFKFGGRVMTAATLLNVDCVVETRTGRTAAGFGSMILGNTWAFPSAALNAEQTLQIMRDLALRGASAVERLEDFGHPIDLGSRLEQAFLAEAEILGRENSLDEAIPKLATLVVGSAFDAALHDAYGKAHGRSCYCTYGREFLPTDLSAWLGSDFQGAWLSDLLREEPVASLAVFHLVGALDPLEAGDVPQPVGDGLPETLGEWIARDGLTHLKIKLNGDDLAWDIARILGVNRIASAADPAPPGGWRYSLDFNERCPNADYLVEVLHKVREQAPAALDRIQYVEQPTARDLRANPQNRMQAAAKLKPVVIDESLVDLESLLLAREMGYTGAALKACKGQTQSLLMAAAAQKLGMFLCVQDLTCPGAAFIHSAGLAAHVPGVAAIEANARQFCPAANRGWEDRFPGVFRLRRGAIDTSGLDRPGLSAV